MLRRLLGLDEGFAAAVVTVLAIGFGSTLVFFASSHLRDAARLAPVERECADWIEDPSGPRWVALKNCRLVVDSAVFRRFQGFQKADGGARDAKFVELFVPLSGGITLEDPPRAILATQDPELLAFFDGITQVPVDEVEGYLRSHAAHSSQLLEPEVLTGYVGRINSMGARAALDQLTAPDAVVLQQGGKPERANAVFTMLVGLLFVGFGVRTVGKRWAMRRAIDGAGE